MNNLISFIAGCLVVSICGYLFIPGIRVDLSHEYKRKSDSIVNSYQSYIDSLDIVNDSLLILSATQDSTTQLLIQDINHLKSRTDASIKDVRNNDNADSLIIQIKSAIYNNRTARD